MPPSVLPPDVAASLRDAILEVDRIARLRSLSRRSSRPGEVTVADLSSDSEQVAAAARAVSAALAQLSAVRLVARRAVRELIEARAAEGAEPYPMPDPPPTQADYEAALRRRLAIVLRARAEGHSYGSIAAAAGVDREWVKRVVRQGSERYSDVTGDLSSLPAEPTTEEF